MRSLKCWIKDPERVMPSLGFRVYWGSELVFQECNLWNPFLVWYTMDSALIKRGDFCIKSFTERINRYIMYVKGMRFLFVILKRKSRRKIGVHALRIWLMDWKKVHKTQMSLCMRLGCGFGFGLWWKNLERMWHRLWGLGFKNWGCFGGWVAGKMWIWW